MLLPCIHPEHYSTTIKTSKKGNLILREQTEAVLGDMVTDIFINILLHSIYTISIFFAKLSAVIMDLHLYVL